MIKKKSIFSRFYTNILGLLDQSVLDSSYSITEVHIIFEINEIDKCTANNLINKLGVDKGYLSRILNHLKEDEKEELINSMKYITRSLSRDKKQKIILLGQNTW
ncbi:MarR family transcriptional regulator [Clostridium tyrobutyricum]|nr:MarR family transcriptional regulator [Clostridium tyrobutyricum]MBV4439845.1 MarR family transcriptional regulator [Clostridium tyrobutyricum]QNB68154.1 MarR family transcriptional regulator [Clostridium tyrobutyricum]